MENYGDSGEWGKIQKATEYIMIVSSLSAAYFRLKHIEITG
jgi:hypothetical protein